MTTPAAGTVTDHDDFGDTLFECASAIRHQRAWTDDAIAAPAPLTRRHTVTRRRVSTGPTLSSSAGDLRDDGVSLAAAGADGSDARVDGALGRTIDAAKKYVVSSTLDRVDWNAELVRGDLGEAVQELKREPGKGLYVGGVQLPLALAELGLTDESEFVVQPRPWATGRRVRGAAKRVD